MREHVEVFEPVFGNKGDVKHNPLCQGILSMDSGRWSGELAPSTIAPLEINLDIRRARDAMDDASQALNGRPSSDKPVEAKAIAIPLALEHRTFNTLGETPLSYSIPYLGSPMSTSSHRDGSPVPLLRSNANLDLSLQRYPTPAPMTCILALVGPVGLSTFCRMPHCGHISPPLLQGQYLMRALIQAPTPSPLAQY